MGYNVNTGQVTATGNFTLNSASPTALTIITGSKNTAGSTVLGTVGAGKKWYIVAASIAMGVTAAAVITHGSLAVNGTPFLHAYVDSTATGFGMNSATLSFPPNYFLVANAGETVTIVNDGSSSNTGSVMYYEVTV